jgi:tetratricopeptide (TPR) repeat protein
MKEPKSPPPANAEAASDTPAAESDAAAPETAPTPAQHHAALLERFRETLGAEGEKAYARWGLSLLYSLDDEQIETQRQALGLKPRDALDHYNHGCLLARREQYAEAAKAFEQAVKLDPALAEADFNHAFALECAGQKIPARKAWVAHLEKFADTPDAAEIKQHLTALVDA